MTKLIRFCFLGVLTISALSNFVHADDDSLHKEALDRSVVLIAKGKDNKTGTWRTSNANGVVVSEDGLVLTVYHFLNRLGDVDPETVEITAQISTKTDVPVAAVVIDGSYNTDLLLLKITQYTKPFVAMDLEEDNISKKHQSADTLFSSGFNGKGSLKKMSGSVATKSVENTHLWGAKNFSIEEGYSGSPVYSGALKLVGLIKGSIKDSNDVAIIPIHYASSLLSQIKFDRMRQEMMARFEHLRKKITWNVKFEGGDLILAYEKFVPDGYDLTALDIELSTSFIEEASNFNGNKEQISSMFPVSQNKGLDHTSSNHISKDDIQGQFKFDGLKALAQNKGGGQEIYKHELVVIYQVGGSGNCDDEKDCKLVIFSPSD